MASRRSLTSAGGVFGWFERAPGRTFAIIGLLFAVAYVTALSRRPAHSRIVDGDAIQYYAYLRSLVFDRDLDFSNDYAELYGAAPESSGWLRERTATGRPRNMMSIGPAILWSPIYLAVVAVAAIGAAFGLSIVVDGFATPFPLAAGVAGIAYATLGIYFCYRVAAMRFGERAAFWGSLLAWLATPALYYSLISPAYSHAASIFTSALFAFVWLRRLRQYTLGRFAVLGALAGLAMLVRWQSVTILLLPVVEILLDREAFAERARRLVIASLTMGVTALVVFSPQLLAWKAIYGGYFVVPQGSGFMRWTEPAVASVLFSARRGLFIWTPAVALAVVGLWALYRRERILGTGAIVVVALSLYVNAAVADWWAGEAFGARRFVGDTVFFALGFAALGARLAIRVNLTWLRAAAVALVIYNGLLLFQYQLFMRGYRDLVPYPATYKQVLIDRLWVPFRVFF